MAKKLKLLPLLALAALTALAVVAPVANADVVDSLESCSGTVESDYDSPPKSIPLPNGMVFPIKGSIAHYGVYSWSYEPETAVLTVQYEHACTEQTKEGYDTPKYVSDTFYAPCFSQEAVKNVKVLVLKGFKDALFSKDEAFSSSLEEIVLSKEMTTTPSLSGLKSLKSLSFEEGSDLEKIAPASFVGCSLERVDFSNCKKLISIGVKPPSGPGMQDSEAFPWGNSRDPNITLKSVVLPETLTELGYGAFAFCSAIESIDLPASLNKIGTYAFNGCDSLEKLEVPENVTCIGANAFTDTAKLSALVLHNSNLSDFSSIQEGMGCALLPPTPEGNQYRSYESITEVIVSGSAETSQVLQDWFNKTGYKPARVTYPLKIVDAVKGLDVKSLNDQDAFNDAKTGYEGLSEAARGCLSDEMKAEVETKLANEEKKLNDFKNPPAPPTPVTPGGGSGGSGGGGATPAPAPSQHEHAWDAGTVTVEPTCTTAGTKVYKCTVAGCTETKTEEIPALGHKFGEWVVTIPATTTSEGVETRTCSVCGATETRSIAKLDDGSGSGSGTSGDKVTVGSTVKVSGITYKVTAKGKVVIKIVSKSTKGKKTVTFPATVKINGKTYKVAGISGSIFKGSKTTTLVIKSKDLTKKGVKNFLKGSKVKTVKIAVSGKKSVNKSYVSKYKKFFTKANCGKNVSLKAA